MKKILPLILFICIAVFGLYAFISTSAQRTLQDSAKKERVVNNQTYTKEIQISYSDLKGKEHIYLIQEPEGWKEKGHILIYMHGAAGKEEQGMDPVHFDGTFNRLRELMDQKDWIYVCPRDPEFEGLLKDLKKRYGDKKVFLSGASAGGIYALAESVKNPDKYGGVLLMCPALWNPKFKLPDEQLLPMRSWIVAGSKDQGNVQGTRKLVKRLESLGRPYRYVEIPGGNHDAPLEKIEWKKALEYLQGEARENKRGLWKEVKEGDLCVQDSDCKSVVCSEANSMCDAGEPKCNALEKCECFAYCDFYGA